jgi:hypothetical protein
VTLLTLADLIEKPPVVGLVSEMHDPEVLEYKEIGPWRDHGDGERSRSLWPVRTLWTLRLDRGDEVCVLQSQSWAFAHSLSSSGLRERLAESGDVEVALSAEFVSFISRNGKDPGKRVEYWHPTVSLVRQ